MECCFSIQKSRVELKGAAVNKEFSDFWPPDVFDFSAVNFPILRLKCPSESNKTRLESYIGVDVRGGRT